MTTEARRGPGRPPIGVVDRVDLRLDADSQAGVQLAARELGGGERSAGVRAVLRAYGESCAVRAAVREHLAAGGE